MSYKLPKETNKLKLGEYIGPSRLLATEEHAQTNCGGGVHEQPLGRTKKRFFLFWFRIFGVRRWKCWQCGYESARQIERLL